MISKEVYRDFLEKLKGRYNSRVLWVGDPGQLPPVGERESAIPFNDTTAVLSEIMRTSAESKIALCANWIRQKGYSALRFFERGHGALSTFLSRRGV